MTYTQGVAIERCTLNGAALGWYKLAFPPSVEASRRRAGRNNITGISQVHISNTKSLLPLEKASCCTSGKPPTVVSD